MPKPDAHRVPGPGVRAPGAAAPPQAAGPPQVESLPLVGRAEPLGRLRAALERAGEGQGATVFLSGESGIGKSRLAREVAAHAARGGWRVLWGRVYPVESSVPFAPFADALVPLLGAMDAPALTTLTRGRSAELAPLFPALFPDADGAATASGSSEMRARTFFVFLQFLARLAAAAPLLIILEDVHHADTSSLELLHFVARQLAGVRLVFVCTFTSPEHRGNAALVSTERSLRALDAATTVALAAITVGDTVELLRSAFDAPPQQVREFAAMLYAWTRGNPFFIEEVIKSLRAAGRLAIRAHGRTGWEVDDLVLPPSIRDALTSRLDAMGADARRVIDWTAAMGARPLYDVLRTVTELPPERLAGAVAELTRSGTLVEHAEGSAITYDFAHPLVRDTAYDLLPQASRQLMHVRIAEALEALSRDRAPAVVDLLAYHYARSDASELTPKAVKYLSAAGRSALVRYANREAASYLGAALARLDREVSLHGERGPNRGDDFTSTREFLVAMRAVLEGLAIARQRIGAYAGAIELWERYGAEARTLADWPSLANAERHMGLACFWQGRHDDALAHYERGLWAADRAGDDALRAQLWLAHATCLEARGRASEASAELQRALEYAERTGDDALRARTHRSCMLFHLWLSEPAAARAHAADALALAEACGQAKVAWSAHWALAILDAVSCRPSGAAEHVRHAEAIADELNSPVLRLWTTEVAIELASAAGEWAGALALAEEALRQSRLLDQRGLLPRLLVWTGIVCLGRGDAARAEEYFEEAWQLCGAGDPEASRDLHSLLRAYVGRVTYWRTTGDYDRALQLGAQALAHIERSGLTAWSVYRLLPLIIECHLRQGHAGAALSLCTQLRERSLQVDHPLGLAFADVFTALAAVPERPDAAREAAAAIDRLEAMPFVYEAARLRRWLGQLVADTDGETAAALLRRAHETFDRIGARAELEETRTDLRALGVRPPRAAGARGAAGLSGRELEIVRLAAAHRTNKEIGRSLGVSARTVSTHLSNIFRKLDVRSRRELADRVREMR